jgi:Matrixin
MKTILAAVAIFGMLGCGAAYELAPPSDPPVQLEAPVQAETPAELPPGIWIGPGLPVATIVHACQVWAPFGVDCTLRQGPARIRFTNWSEDHCPTAEETGNMPIVTGRGTPDGEVILFAACLTDPVAMEHTAAHEIGHVFGLHHVENADALMFWYSGATVPALTDADRAEWGRVHQAAP